MIADTLANADPLISGSWIIAVIGAIASGAALFWGKQQGKKEATETKISGQPIGIKMHPDFVTHEVFQGHIARIEDDINEIKGSLDGERSIARLANGNLHKRIDALSESLGGRLAHLEGSVEKVAETTNKLLDLALSDHAKPKGGRS